MKLFKTAVAAASLGLSLASLNANAGVYFFGDSLSDTGNLFLATGLPQSDNPGNLAYAPGQYTDKYGNGVWSQQFAAALGMEAKPSLAGGTNFSWAGARTYTVTAKPATATTPAVAGTPPGVTDQIAQYVSLPGRAGANDLFVIMIGGNDVDAGLRSGNAAGAINSGLANIKAGITALAGEGAKRILIANMPNVADTPLIRASADPDPRTTTNETIDAVNQFVQGWNLGFGLLVGQLQQTFTGIDFDVLDLFGLGTLTSAQYGALGITNTTVPCLLVPDTPVGAQARSCSTSLYSDPFHPSAVAHGIIARNALAAIPVPASLALVGLGLIGLIGLRRKQA